MDEKKPVADKPPVDTKMMDAEVKRYFSKLIKAGIDPKFALTPYDDVRKLDIVDNLHVLKIAEVIRAVKNGAKTGLVVFVYGGSSTTRKKLAQYLLGKAILKNLDGLGEIGVSLYYSELISKINNYNEERMLITDNMKRIPCLSIVELDPNAQPKTEVDAKSMFNSVIESRRDSGLITIISVNTQDFENLSPQGAWGPVFEELIVSAKELLPNNINVMFVRAFGGSDAITAE